MTLRILGSCGLLLAAGCGVAPSDSAEEAAAAPPAEAAGAVAAPEAMPMDTILSELTQAVRKYGAERRSVPKELEELVAHGYLGQLPPAPAGKRFVITRDLRVVLE